MCRNLIGTMLVALLVVAVGCEKPAGSGGAEETAQPTMAEQGDEASVKPPAAGPAADPKPEPAEKAHESDVAEATPDDKAPTTQPVAIDEELMQQIMQQVREVYLANARKELKRLEDRLEELRGRLAEQAEEAKPALREKVEALGARVERVRETLSKLSGASNEAWDELRKGIDRAFQELRDGMAEPAGEPPSTTPADNADG